MSGCDESIRDIDLHSAFTQGLNQGLKVSINIYHKVSRSQSTQDLKVSSRSQGLNQHLSHLHLKQYLSHLHLHTPSAAPSVRSSVTVETFASAIED